MLWEDVKKSFPSQWVLIEAVNAHTEGSHRIVEQVSVVESFLDNSKQALKKYVELHKQHKDREYYVIHTSREQLDFEELRWMGVRPG